MAYVPGGQTIDEEETTIEDPNAPPVIPGVGGAAGAAGTAGAGVAVAPAEPTSTPKEAGFVDVASYLSANRPQATQFAGEAAEKLEKSAGEIRGTIEEASGIYGQAVEEGTTRLDEELLARARQDPSAFIQDQPSAQQLEQQRTAQFQSPGAYKEQEFFPSVTQAIEEGQRLGQLGESEAGRRELLYSLGRNPTRGQVELDQLLLGGTPEARERIQAASQQFYGEIPEYLEAEALKGQQLAQTGEDITAQTRQSIQSQLAASQTSLEEAIQQQIEAKRADAARRTENIETVLQNLITYDPSRMGAGDPSQGPYMPRMIPPEWEHDPAGYFESLKSQYTELTPESIGDLGLSVQELREMSNELYNLKYGGRWDPSKIPGTQTYGGAPQQLKSYQWETMPPVWPPPVSTIDLYNRDIDLTQYLTPTVAEQEIRAANVATPEQYADYMALAQMADVAPQMLLPGQEELAGTAPDVLARFDPQAIRQRTADALREQDIEAIRSGVRWIGERPVGEFEEAWENWAGPGGWIERMGYSPNAEEALAKMYYGRNPGGGDYHARQQLTAKAAWRLGLWGGPTYGQQRRYRPGGPYIGIPEIPPGNIPMPERF